MGIDSKKWTSYAAVCSVIVAVIVMAGFVNAKADRCDVREMDGKVRTLEVNFAMIQGEIRAELANLKNEVRLLRDELRSARVSIVE